METQMYKCKNCEGYFPVEKMTADTRRKFRIGSYCKKCAAEMQREVYAIKKQQTPNIYPVFEISKPKPRPKNADDEVAEIESRLAGSGGKVLSIQEFEVLCRRRHILLIRKIQQAIPVCAQKETVYQGDYVRF